MIRADYRASARRLADFSARAPRRAVPFAGMAGKRNSGTNGSRARGVPGGAFRGPGGPPFGRYAGGPREGTWYSYYLMAAIERVAILGGGLMGSGIAESVARAGLP